MPWAKLKPHDPKRGALIKDYNIRGHKFVAGGPAIEVDEEVAERLRDMRNQSPQETPAFEVQDEPFEDQPSADMPAKRGAGGGRPASSSGRAAAAGVRSGRDADREGGRTVTSVPSPSGPAARTPVVDKRAAERDAERAEKPKS